MEVVYAQKVLHRDSHRLQCDSFKEKNEKYLCCEDGWVLKDDIDDDNLQHHRHNRGDEKSGGSKPETKFRQVWIQGFVVEYVQAKDWLLVNIPR